MPPWGGTAKTSQFGRQKCHILNMNKLVEAWQQRRCEGKADLIMRRLTISGQLTGLEGNALSFDWSFLCPLDDLVEDLCAQVIVVHWQTRKRDGKWKSTAIWPLDVTVSFRDLWVLHNWVHFIDRKPTFIFMCFHRHWSQIYFLLLPW